MINHVQQPLSILPHGTNTHTFTGDPGHLCGALPSLRPAASPLGRYSTHHHNSEEIYKRGRKKIPWVTGSGKSRVLTWTIAARPGGLGLVSSARAVRHILKHLCEAGYHSLPRRGKLRLGGTW